MRHTIYRRVLACLCVLLVFSQIVQVAVEEHNRAQAAEQVLEEQEKLTLWYTDEKLNLYLVNAANQFQQETGVEVTLQLVTAVDYIELINRASISEGGGPDLFVTSSELLEKARLAGLTVENDSFRDQEPPAGASLWPIPFILRPAFYSTTAITWTTPRPASMRSWSIRIPLRPRSVWQMWRIS